MPTRKRLAAAPAEVIEEAAPAPPALVRLIPVPGVYIYGEPAAEREVTAEEAERLLSFNPPAYRKAPAASAAEPAEAEVPPIPEPPADASVEPEPQE